MTLSAAWCRFLCEGNRGRRAPVSRCTQRSVGGGNLGYEAKGNGDLAMSRPDEPDATNPNDLTYYAPRELRERAKSGSLSQEVRSEPDRSSYRPSSDVRPVYLRPPSAPGAIQQYGVLEREPRRTGLFGVAGRFAAVAAFVMVVALLFVVISPALRQSGASSTPSEITGINKIRGHRIDRDCSASIQPRPERSEARAGGISRRARVDSS